MDEPFFETGHRMLSERIRAFGEKEIPGRVPMDADPQDAAQAFIGLLARGNFLTASVVPPFGTMDARSLAAVREGLSYFSGVADGAFATQALGALPLALGGTDAQKARWLPAVARGEVVAAFAVAEPEAGSDISAVRTSAERDGALWRLAGVKTLISNAGIAGFYTVLARSSNAEGSKGLSMFLVDAEAPGIAFKRLDTLASQAMGELHFASSPAVLLGGEGQGYALALAVYEWYRPSVGAAACGLAARALDESVRWALARRQFGRSLSQHQGVRMALADMKTDLDAARLLVARAAWSKDLGRPTFVREGAQAKLQATETAQRVVDRAVQIHGGQGILKGATVERLYREVRALRIDGGTSEIQKLIVAREMLKESR